MSNAEQWPPDPATIDLNDPDWMTVKQAETVPPFYRERAIRALIAEHDVSIKAGKYRYISRRRFNAAICRIRQVGG